MLDETRALEKSDYGEIVRMYREIKGGWEYDEFNRDTLQNVTKTMPLGIDLQTDSIESIRNYQPKGKSQEKFIEMFLVTNDFDLIEKKWTFRFKSTVS